MKLTKTIPARKKTVKFLWCKREWSPMSQAIRDVRENFDNKLDKCYWCGHRFVDGEMMAVAAPEKSLNKVLCQKCAAELLESE